MQEPTLLPIRKWILFTALGWILGVLIILVFAGIEEALKVDFQFLLGLGMGIGVGFMQWFVLKKIFDKAGNWVISLVIGLTSPFLLVDILSQFMNCYTEKNLLPLIALGGMITGYLQYRLFLKNHAKSAWKWILYSALIWFVVCFFTMGFYPLLNLRNMVESKHVLDLINIVLFILSGPFLGSLSVYALNSILKKK